MKNENFDIFPPAMQQAFISLMRSHERLDEQMKETARRVNETTANIQLMMERSNRFDERIAQTTDDIKLLMERSNRFDERIAQTTDDIKLLVKRSNGSDERSNRLDERIDRCTANIERISRDIEKTHQDIDKLYKAQGRAENNRGAEVEEFFYNTLMHEPVIGTMQFDKVLSNHMVGRKGKETELDLLLINGNSLAVIEVKSKFHPNDLDQLQEHIDFLRDHSPEFKNYQFYGGIAGFSIPNDVTKAAHEKGYFVLKRRGKIITVNTQGMTAQ